ncbi:hypothetical protein [Nocardioides sp. Iso805N]|uniref:hypothetical protein n=1 Tax=Nocardioides sp. Iso805N TaxID=1283287 RepID=UPI00037EA8F2|nr:hypothetical protein [Nocardioides sp. Iso805N]
MTTGDERTRALRFVREDAGFARVLTSDAAGHLVGRTASAFLNDDWTVDTVQRAMHRRVKQLERDGRVLVMWSGEPAADSVNDSPSTFDLGLTIPRVVFVRGVARPLDADATWEVYHRHSERLRAAGHTKAPVRDRADIDENFAGVRIEPRWIRLEGFGRGAESFTWTIRPSS